MDYIGINANGHDDLPPRSWWSAAHLVRSGDSPTSPYRGAGVSRRAALPPVAHERHRPAGDAEVAHEAAAQRPHHAGLTGQPGVAARRGVRIGDLPEQLVADLLRRRGEIGRAHV